MPERDNAFSAFAAVIGRAVAPLAPAPATLARLAAATELVAIDKGEHLLRAGDVARHLLFVWRGLLRYYYLDEAGGEERTGQFFDENRVFTDAGSFLEGTPSPQSIQALEPSDILRVPQAALYAAYDADHGMERFGRFLVEQALVGAQRRSRHLLTLTPDERYRRFAAERPEVARRVPQYLIASYLGITPEGLSRIRGRLNRRPPG